MPRKSHPKKPVTEPVVHPRPVLPLGGAPREETSPVASPETPTLSKNFVFLTPREAMCGTHLRDDGHRVASICPAQEDLRAVFFAARRVGRLRLCARNYLLLWLSGYLGIGVDRVIELRAGDFSLPPGGPPTVWREGQERRELRPRDAKGIRDWIEAEGFAPNDRLFPVTERTATAIVRAIGGRGCAHALVRFRSGDSGRSYPSLSFGILERFCLPKGTERLLVSSREQSAHHESGHAVMAWNLGRRVRHVTIGRELLAEIYPENPEMGPVGRTKYEVRKKDHEDNARIGLAGAVAEYLVTGRQRLILRDWRPGKPLLGETSDRSVVDAAASALVGRSPEKLERFRIECWRATEAFLTQPPVWKQVRIVAHALLQRERLTADDFERVVGGERWNGAQRPERTRRSGKSS